LPRPAQDQLEKMEFSARGRRDDHPRRVAAKQALGAQFSDYDALEDGVVGRPHLHGASRTARPSVDVGERPQWRHQNARHGYEPIRAAAMAAFQELEERRRPLGGGDPLRAASPTPRRRRRALLAAWWSLAPLTSVPEFLHGGARAQVSCLAAHKTFCPFSLRPQSVMEAFAKSWRRS
jgi:hypothetical protein